MCALLNIHYKLFTIFITWHPFFFLFLSIFFCHFFRVFYYEFMCIEIYFIENPLSFFILLFFPSASSSFLRSFFPSFWNCTGSHDVPGPDFLGLTSVAWVRAKSLQLCPILCDLTDCSPPGFSVHGILQAIILEWVIISFSRGSSRPRNQTQISYVSCIGRWVLYN